MFAHALLQIITRYTYDGVLHDTLDLLPYIVVPGVAGVVVVGLCASQLRDETYALTYCTNTDWAWRIFQFFGTTICAVSLTNGTVLPADNPIYSMSCSDKHLTLSCGNFTPPAALTLNYDISTSTAITQISTFNTDTGSLLSYIDNNDNYYIAASSGPTYYFFQSRITDNNPIIFFNVPSQTSQVFLFVRFLGSDTWNNILVCFQNIDTSIYSIVAYSKLAQYQMFSNPLYTIQMGAQEPITLSQFTTVIHNSVGPSLTPNYQIWNYLQD